MPEQVIEKIKKNILPEWKVCFITALVMGIVAHLYKITNWLPNWDGLVFRYDPQNMVALGRWFLPVVCSVSSFYDLPLITGLMAIIFHGLGAVCIVKMFGVKKYITAGIIGALVVTYPVVASVMMYNYVADGYSFAFLLSCVAAMLLTKEKPCYICSAILMALSAGIYQAYITITITLLVLGLILEVLYKETEFKKVLLKGLKFLITGIVGMGLYYLIMVLTLKLTGTRLLEYQGFDSAASLEGIDILGALYTIKNSFISYFFDFSNGLSAFSIINCVVFVLTFIMYLTDIIKIKLRISNILMVCVCVCLLPIGAGALSFINSNIDYHNLMKMGLLVFYLPFILQYEKSDKIKIKNWSILCVAILLVFNQVIIANVSYHKLTMAYEKSYGTLIRIADRIEQTEGANDCDSIAIFGSIKGSEAYSANLPPDMTGTTDGYILRADDETVEQSVLCSALNDYCGKNYRFLTHKDKIGIYYMADVENLGVWPEKDSVSVIDDVIIIKMGD